MTGFTAASLGLKSKSFTAGHDIGLTPRVIINVEGNPKEGKTSFALTAPDPIIIYNFDQGLEGPLEPHLARGRKIVVAGMPPAAGKKSGKYQSYAFSRPDPGKFGYRSDGYMELVRKEALPIWKQFVSDFHEGLQSAARTLVVDTGGATFQLAKLAFVGMDKFTTAEDPYSKRSSEMKSIFQGILVEGYNYDKNVIFLHRLQEIWVGNQPSGRYGVSGYRETAGEVQFSVRLQRKGSKKDVFTATVRDCRLDRGMEGEVFDGKLCNFSTVVAAVTRTDPEDWE